MTAGARQAHQVCILCKNRKKKCDKALPSCGYCTRKGLSCSYQDGWRRSHDSGVGSPGSARQSLNGSPATHAIGVPSVSDAIPTDPMALRTNLYIQVNRIIRSTGQFVDDITARYFQGIHHFIPVVSRTRFHDNLITLGATPAADFSILLLSICLITHNPSPGTSRLETVDQHTIHVSARSLFAQLQAVLPPSVHLIQAGLLISMYEYAHGQVDQAFASITGCARIAYSARIHNRDFTRRAQETGVVTELEAEEAFNTWWGLVICERTIVCDVTVPEQPLVTIAPSEDARLPTESEVLAQGDSIDLNTMSNVLVSSPISIEVGGFGRAAQAASHLDQVLKGFQMPDLRSRLVHLDFLDLGLQGFLKLVMQQCQGKWAIFCGAIALAIRTLFVLHQHILALPAEEIANANYKAPDKWFEGSLAALDTITKMTVDIAESHENVPPHVVDSMPPSLAYILRAALQHIHSSTRPEDPSWSQSAEGRLQGALARFNRRWGVRDS
ncbi:hypothetical protein F4677DRAFT_443607 [Hypoxylon crocopeplum]|nr:hypothetical protein F4677DRAFT_443607 [Hypoxylon crocopeplum]